MRFLSKPWPAIKKAFNAGRVNAAVTPYLGTGAFTLLPLRKPSDVLVVDASSANVKAGLTNPHEIEQFKRKHVRCYSVKGLHAKVYRADNSLFIGSANASANSEKTLIEACVEVKNANVVAEFNSWLEALALIPITLERVEELKKIYKPPKFKSSKTVRLAKSTSWITWVETEEDDDDMDEYLEEVAASHELEDEDMWGVSLPSSQHPPALCRLAKAGDDLFVIDHTRGKVRVYRPARLVEPAKLINGRYYFALEDPGEEVVTLSTFIKTVQMHYAGFPKSGMANRTIKPAAAADLRRLWK